MFPGQGSQWPGMARRLLTDEPAFAHALAEIEPVFVEQVGFSQVYAFKYSPRPFTAAPRLDGRVDGTRPMDDPDEAYR